MGRLTQPPTERMPLIGYKPLIRTTTHGWPAILLGGAFALVGSPILAIGMRWMDYPSSFIHTPLWILNICGGLFVVCGDWLMIHGALGLHCQWNLSKGKQ